MKYDICIRKNSSNEINQPKSIKANSGGHKLRSGVNGQGTFMQKDIKKKVLVCVRVRAHTKSPMQQKSNARMIRVKNSTAFCQFT